MTNNGFSKLGLTILDRITDVFPSFGQKLFHKIILSIFGSNKSYSYYLTKFQRQLLKTKNFDKILFIVDINIGDAVMLQRSMEALRNFFPHARLDYLCNQQGGELIPELPMADNVYKVFKRGGVPSESDLNELREIITTNKYDLIFNLSPFLKRKMVYSINRVIELYIPFSAYIIYLMKNDSKQMNISHIIYAFLNDFLKPLQNKNKKNSITSQVLPKNFKGNTVYLSHDAIQSANIFFQEHNIYSLDNLLLFNPDATIKYSMIPFGIQVLILKRVLEADDIDYVLLSSAYSNPGLEMKLLNSIPAELHSKILIVPHMRLETFTALIDLCHVFVSGDTGPLHIAASWKEPLDGNDHLRNQTAVISIIGPTDSRIFCYDSTREGHMAAFQDAPSKVFVGDAPCRNITCLNKTGKTCKEVRCFNNIDPEEISSYIISYFHYLRTSIRKIG